MKHSLFKGKSTRTKAFTLITVGVILVVLAVNYLLTYLVSSKGMYVDLTPEELYTLSDAMKKECEFVDTLDDGEDALTITFCSDPDQLTSSAITRTVYFMALDMEREFENIEVREINSIYNPTALSDYRTTSLTAIKPTDVIISYRGIYRIVSADSFWTKSNESTYFSFNGEYRMATLIKSVTAINKPVAYFTTGHGETVYNGAAADSEMSVKAAGIYDLLSEQGLTVKTINLKDTEIPDDCALLVINDPREDFKTDSTQADSFFYRSETDKIDYYLRKNQGALMVMRDPSLVDENGDGVLKNLDALLYEWGFDFSSSTVIDGENSIGSSTNVIGVYETDTNSYANAIYGDFASLPSAPYTVFSDVGYINCSFYENMVKNEDGAGDVTLTYESFMKSYDTAVALKDGVIDSENTALDLAAVSVRKEHKSDNNESNFSYVFCVNSADFLSVELLSNRTYANYDIVSAVVNNISRNDVYASMELGGLSLNSPKYGGKQLIYDNLTEQLSEIYNADATYKGYTLGFTGKIRTVILVVTLAVPAIPLVIGIVIKLRRKFL